MRLGVVLQATCGFAQLASYNMMHDWLKLKCLEHQADLRLQSSALLRILNGSNIDVAIR